MHSEPKTYWRKHPNTWHQTADAKLLLSERERNILDEALSYVGDIYEFEKNVEQLVLWSDRPVLNRLLRWIDFLNRQRERGNPIANAFLFDVMAFFEEERFIHQQTQPQFELTQAYISELLTWDLPDLGIKSTRFLLMLCLLLSYRPDVQLRTFKKGQQVFSGLHKEVCLFKYLFVDKSIPEFLIPHLDYCEKDELQVVFGLLERKSLNHCLPKHLSLSKKERAVLHGNTISLEGFQDRILERYVYTAKLVKEHPKEKQLIKSLLNSSKIFRDDFPSFKEDLSFWQSVYRFLIRDKDAINYEWELSEIIDYFEYQRYYTEYPLTYSLKGRTLASVKRAMEQWHLHQAYYQPQFLRAAWKPLPIEKWMHRQGDSSHIIEEITSGKELHKEGNLLYHCVFSYIQSCCWGSVHIFRMSKLKNGKKKPFYTIEVRDGKIIQVRGKFNKLASEAILKIIDDWARENGLLTITGQDLI